MKIDKIKKIFEKYKIYKLRVENFKHIDCLMDSEKKNMKEKFLNWDKYVKLINKILASLDEELAYILKSIYIENKKRDDLHYSESTFYWKHKKATGKFLKYIDF